MTGYDGKSLARKRPWFVVENAARKQACCFYLVGPCTASSPPPLPGRSELRMSETQSRSMSTF